MILTAGHPLATALARATVPSVQPLATTITSSSTQASLLSA